MIIKKTFLSLSNYLLSFLQFIYRSRQCIWYKSRQFIFFNRTCLDFAQLLAGPDEKARDKLFDETERQETSRQYKKSFIFFLDKGLR